MSCKKMQIIFSSTHNIINVMPMISCGLMTSDQESSLLFTYVGHFLYIERIERASSLLTSIASLRCCNQCTLTVRITVRIMKTGVAVACSPCYPLPVAGAIVRASHNISHLTLNERIVAVIVAMTRFTIHSSCQRIALPLFQYT